MMKIITAEYHIVNLQKSERRTSNSAGMSISLIITNPGSPPLNNEHDDDNDQADGTLDSDDDDYISF